MLNLAVVMLLALLSVAAFKIHQRRNPVAKQCESVESVSDFLSIVAVSILLPIIFLEAFARNIDSIGKIAIGIFYGAALALITLGLGAISRKLVSQSLVDRVTHVVGATFGGGNRGVILLLVASAVLVFDTNIYFAYFYAVDFGNFLVFLFVVPIYLQRLYGKRATVEPVGISGLLSNVGAPNIIVIVSAALLYFGVGDSVGEWLVAALEPTSKARSFLLLYLSFCLIFLRIDISVGTARLVANWLFITGCRASALLILIVFINAGQEWTASALLQNGYLLALAILVLCPPSSLVGGQIARNVDDPAVAEFANALNLFMVAVYFIAILTLSAIGWAIAVS